MMLPRLLSAIEWLFAVLFLLLGALITVTAIALRHPFKDLILGLGYLVLGFWVIPLVGLPRWARVVLITLGMVVL